jgi:hypothetical protein
MAYEELQYIVDYSQNRSNVEGSSCAVGGNKGKVVVDQHLTGVQELLVRHRRHTNANHTHIG